MFLPDDPRMRTAESLIQFLQTFDCPGRCFPRVLPSVWNPVYNHLLTVPMGYAAYFNVEACMIRPRVCFGAAGIVCRRVAVIREVATFREKDVRVFKMLWRRKNGAHGELPSHCSVQRRPNTSLYREYDKDLDFGVAEKARYKL